MFPLHSDCGNALVDGGCHFFKPNRTHQKTTHAMNEYGPFSGGPYVLQPNNQSDVFHVFLFLSLGASPLL